MLKCHLLTSLTLVKRFTAFWLQSLQIVVVPLLWPKLQMVSLCIFIFVTKVTLALVLTAFWLQHRQNVLVYPLQNSPVLAVGWLLLPQQVVVQLQCLFHCLLRFRNSVVQFGNFVDKWLVYKSYLYFCINSFYFDK